MDNYLSNSMHGAKTLTQHIGLKYNKIHACSFGLYCIKGSMQISLTAQSVGRKGINKLDKY